MTNPKELSDARMETFDHPCKQTCSGWTQGYEKGYTAALQTKTDKVQILRGALELLLAKEDKFGRLRQFQGEIVLSPQELEFARAALKSYDQTDEGV